MQKEEGESGGGNGIKAEKEMEFNSRLSKSIESPAI